MTLFALIWLASITWCLFFVSWEYGRIKVRDIIACVICGPLAMVLFFIDAGGTAMPKVGGFLNKTVWKQ